MSPYLQQVDGRALSTSARIHDILNSRLCSHCATHCDVVWTSTLSRLTEAGELCFFFFFPNEAEICSADAGPRMDTIWH